MTRLKNGAASLILLISFAVPAGSRAQNGEARCSSSSSPLKHYLLRVDGGLKKLDANEVLEVSKNDQLCAATLKESEDWLKTLKDGRQRFISESQKQLDDIRKRIKRNEKLKGDVDALKTSLDASYDDQQATVKDSIKFALDALVAEGLLVDKFLEASKSLLLSRAIADGTISFAVDSTSVIVKGTGRADGGKNLKQLIVNELVAEVGATIIAERWIKPPIDRLKDIATKMSESTARSLLEGAKDLSATAMTASELLAVFDRNIAFVEAFILATSPRSAALNGIWKSTDSDHRFTLNCFNGACQWTERTKGGEQLARSAALIQDTSGFRLERANDEDVLSFLGYQPSLRSEILQRSPMPSFLLLSMSANSLTGQWYGLLVTKDQKAKLKELRNPGQSPAKTYHFSRVP